MHNDEPDSPKGQQPKTAPIVDTLRSDRKGMAVGLYPGDIHPGLLSGVGIDDHKRDFGIDKVIFGVTASLIVGFVLWGVLSPESVGAVAGVAFTWSMENMGWLLNLAMGVGLFVMLYVAFGRYGKIKLGKDDEKPEFSRFSWVAMMFGAGLGVGLFFYGPSEPLAYFVSPPPHTLADTQETLNALQVAAGEEPQINREAIHQGVSQASYHWGLHIWSMYALVGGALAYATFRRGRPTLISSIFQSLFGKSQTQGFAGPVSHSDRPGGHPGQRSGPGRQQHPDYHRWCAGRGLHYFRGLRRLKRHPVPVEYQHHPDPRTGAVRLLRGPDAVPAEPRAIGHPALHRQLPADDGQVVVMGTRNG